MNFYKHKIVLCLIIITARTSAENIVSEEAKNFQTDRKEKNTYNVHGSDRRFLDNLNDDQWHVAHLKDTDFVQRRSDCKVETFDDKLKRYRKNLLNDGALVDYVSAFAIPNDPKDLAPDVCQIPEDVERIFKPVKTTEGPSKIKTTLTQETTKAKINEETSKAKINQETSKGTNNKTVTTAKGKINHETAKAKINQETAKAKINQETTKAKINQETTKAKINQETTKAKINQETAKTTKNKTVTVETATTQAEEPKKETEKDDKRRANDYQFSSDEYYGDAPNFDVRACPDIVIEVVLEIDHIRNYDVECQLMLDWRTLE